MARITERFGVSSSTVYHALVSVRQFKGLRRADRGAVDVTRMNRYCTIVAVLKVRTVSGQGRKLSTAKAIANRRQAEAIATVDTSKSNQTLCDVER